jgi:ATP-dependent DNA helicase RecG
VETLSDILDALTRPLAMASRDHHAYLDRVRNLDEIVPVLASRGAARSRNPFTRKALGEMARDFEKFADLPLAERCAAVDRALAMIDRARAAEASAGLASFQDLRAPITGFRGIGEKIGARLEKLGIRTAWDALWHLPREYEERLPPQPIAEVRPGTVATVDARVRALGSPRIGRNRVRVHEVLFEDETGAIRGVWYNYVPRLARGDRVRLIGEVGIARGGHLVLHVPEVYALRPGAPLPEAAGPGPVSRYPLTAGVTERQMRALLGQVASSLAPRVPELIPDSVTRPLDLPPLSEAMRDAHLPPKDAAAREKAGFPALPRRRIAFEELFFLELYLGLLRRDVARGAARPCPGGGKVERAIRAALPWSLTGAQGRVLGEIEGDLARPHPMHRLLQGDVGSGKTVVALLACARAIDAKLQTAVMAPTEILAEQHFRTLAPLLRPAGIRSALLTAGIARPERARTLRGVAEGAIPLVVGTHALIEEEVRFRRLGLAVVDEQHRFGVEQRVALRAKAPAAAGASRPTEEPHLLAMTATPIPRSLALTVYGDLDLSVIDEMPPGREPVETRHYTERQRGRAYAAIREVVEAGRQVFVVYPLVSESEKIDLRDATRMAEALRAEFPGFRIGLVHGKLRSAEKEAAMGEFQRGAIQVMVATTVIEVGIDVPNATLMIVEHAERFGLSQLHQLRGRVGRGGGRALCLLLTPPLSPKSEAFRRMKVMEREHDGFRIAQEDLAIRGPGDFLGTRQHGLPDFRVADLIADAPLIAQAREAARAILERDPDLSRPGHEGLREGLGIYMEGRIGKIRAG